MILLRTDPSMLLTMLPWLLFDALEPVLLALDRLPLAELRSSDALCLLTESLLTLLPSGSRDTPATLLEALLVRIDGHLDPTRLDRVAWLDREAWESSDARRGGGTGALPCDLMDEPDCERDIDSDADAACDRGVGVTRVFDEPDCDPAIDPDSDAAAASPASGPASGK